MRATGAELLRAELREAEARAAAGGSEGAPMEVELTEDEWKRFGAKRLDAQSFVYAYQPIGGSLGTVWRCLGPERPKHGDEWPNNRDPGKRLAEALCAPESETDEQGVRAFGEDRWKSFQLYGLHEGHFIRGRDGSYFHPVAHEIVVFKPSVLVSAWRPADENGRCW